MLQAPSSPTLGGRRTALVIRPVIVHRGELKEAVRIKPKSILVTREPSNRTRTFAHLAKQVHFNRDLDP